MAEKDVKKETIKILDVMIKNAEKGVSGFWTDDYEGCGNPLIFPEFEEGLKYGKYVSKNHFYCPWNTAIMYGDGRGSITTGCYHSCSIYEAKYLSPELIRNVLKRFKRNIEKGVYDKVEHIKPLLTKAELDYISEQKKNEEKQQKLEEMKRKNYIKQKASKLLAKYRDDESIVSKIYAYYDTNMVCICDGGSIDFSRERMSDVRSSGKLSYNDYLDVQFATLGKKYRGSFQQCYYEYPSSFKGEIEKITPNGKICFKRIFVTGMYHDDLSFFDGKEEHVWMDSAGFEEYKIGDCLEFFAEIYRYIKTGGGKQLDFGLCNPQGIKLIEAYELPTDEELQAQMLSQIICETCYLSEHCNRVYCIRSGV